MRNRIYWSSSFSQTDLNKYGLVILPISESMEIGFTSVWHWIYIPERSWVTKYPINPSTNLATATFRKAFKGRGRLEGLTFHSDRGKQYTSKPFTALLGQCGVRQSFSASGRPHDNAVAETFFVTFKKEEAYRREYTSEQSFCKSVEKYVQFFSETRPHRTLKYKTLREYENAYEASFR